MTWNNVCFLLPRTIPDSCSHTGRLSGKVVRLCEDAASAKCIPPREKSMVSIATPHKPNKEYRTQTGKEDNRVCFKNYESVYHDRPRGKSRIVGGTDEQIDVRVRHHSPWSGFQNSITPRQRGCHNQRSGFWNISRRAGPQRRRSRHRRRCFCYSASFDDRSERGAMSCGT